MVASRAARGTSASPTPLPADALVHRAEPGGALGVAAPGVVLREHRVGADEQHDAQVSGSPTSSTADPRSARRLRQNGWMHRSAHRVSREQTLRWRGGWIRVGSWRGDDDVAYLSVGADRPPTARDRRPLPRDRSAARRTRRRHERADAGRRAAVRRRRVLGPRAAPPPRPRHGRTCPARHDRPAAPAPADRRRGARARPRSPSTTSGGSTTTGSTTRSRPRRSRASASPGDARARRPTRSPAAPGTRATSSASRSLPSARREGWGRVVVADGLALAAPPRRAPDPRQHPARQRRRRSRCTRRAGSGDSPSGSACSAGRCDRGSRLASAIRTSVGAGADQAGVVALARSPSSRERRRGLRDPRAQGAEEAPRGRDHASRPNRRGHRSAATSRSASASTATRRGSTCGSSCTAAITSQRRVRADRRRATSLGGTIDTVESRVAALPRRRGRPDCSPSASRPRRRPALGRPASRSRQPGVYPLEISLVDGDGDARRRLRDPPRRGHADSSGHAGDRRATRRRVDLADRRGAGLPGRRQARTRGRRPARARGPTRLDRRRRSPRRPACRSPSRPGPRRSQSWAALTRTEPELGSGHRVAARARPPPTRRSPAPYVPIDTPSLEAGRSRVRDRRPSTPPGADALERHARDPRRSPHRDRRSRRRREPLAPPPGAAPTGSSCGPLGARPARQQVHAGGAVPAREPGTYLHRRRRRRRPRGAARGRRSGRACAPSAS